MQQANISWSENQPASQEFNDVYYSTEGGRAEKEYVFLQHNGLPQRWLSSQRFVIGETGFGTGLSFLVTADIWLKTSQPQACLYYFSVEKYPLCKSDLGRVLSAWPEYSELANRLLDSWPEPVQGFHSIEIIHNRVVLCLMLGDVMDMLPAMVTKVDAWYLDGFSPQRNPEMWSQNVLNCIAQNSHATTTFSTYTAAGDVHRGLIEAGFNVQKVNGFASKRNMLHGTLQRQQHRSDTAPWFALTSCAHSATRVAVIGAGLAGITTAWSLAQRGWQVDLYDSHADVAQGGSGNPAGVLLPRVAVKASSEAEFYASAFFMALRNLAKLKQQYTDLVWSQSGVIQLLSSERLQKQYASAEPDSHYVCKLSAHDARNISGVSLNNESLFYPLAGWLDPRSLCDVLLHDAGERVKRRFNTDITRLVQRDRSWLLFDKENHQLGDYPVVVLANAHQVKRFSQTAWLNVVAARGQITYLPITKKTQQLKCPICYDGYVLPAVNGQHVIGASFITENDSSAIVTAEHTQNLLHLQQYLPGFAADEVMNQNVALEGRAAVRAVTPDRLPMVGAVPDFDYVQRNYSDLQRGKPASFYPAGRSMAGLYVNVGHGARGFTSTSLAAQLLAALITGDVLPVSLPVLHALHPARFYIRQSRKGKLTTL